MSLLSNKKVLIIGDRDGIPGPAIEECVKTVEGAEVVFSSTECFVWTAAGAMDLENQNRVKDAADKFGAENVVILLGAAEAEAGVALGLSVYHVVEEPIKSLFDESVYEDQISMMEMVLEVEEIEEEMSGIREEFCKF